MSASGARPGGRAAGARAKTRPILQMASARSRRRETVAVTAGRTKGVEHSTTPPRLHTSASPGSLLLAEAVATALESLSVLERHTQEVADAFRWDRIGEAQRGLTDLIHSTQTLLQVAAMVAQATGVDFATLCGPDGLRAQDDTSAVLDLIIAQQLADDWTGLSDTLDQDFTSMLAQWRLVFETLCGPPADGGPGGRAA